MQCSKKETTNCNKNRRTRNYENSTITTGMR